MIDMNEFNDNALPERLFPIIKELSTMANTAAEKDADQDEAIAGKQATLVSGTNLKTVGGVSLLGAGNLPISTDAGLYACSVWKEGDAINGVSGAIGGYNAVWVNDGQLDTATGVYTVPVTGLYEVEFDAFKHNNVLSTEARLYKNGSPTGVRGYASGTQGNTGPASAGTAHIHFYSGETQYVPIHFKAAGYFNAGDQLQVYVPVGQLHANESCYLNIHKVR